MASAVLSNRNEPNWPQHRSSGAEFMGKTPFSNPNPNSKPKLANSKRTQSASDDASSINRRTNDVSHSQRVTFNVASYSKNELNELKRRLVLELEQIRNLKNRIESGEFQPQRKSTNKKISGNKRPLQLNPLKDFKRSNSDIEMMMKGCGQVLQKLIRHKHAYHFKAPVDVVAMNLHDYYDIIKRPMDLGTVNLNLSKRIYATPAEFASDVRLVFNNALTYNPKGHIVNTAAEQLLARFENLYRPLHEKYEECLNHDRHFEEELQASSWNHVEPPERVKKKRENPIPPAEYQHPEPPQPPASSSRPPVEQPPPPSVQSPVRTPSPMQVTPVKPLKQPKPKARDLNKRDMSSEEKQKLGTGLQSLPDEKMEQVVQIIRKRNGHLEQDGDEIELDIEVIDTETLWELDRFVTNWKKMMSKIKRQSLMGNVTNNVASNNDNGEVPASEKVDEVSPVEAKKPKKAEAGDEDVDIGDDMPMSVFPPVEIEKDKDVVLGGHASSSSSSSSSSGSDSSSSSDSDSGSSSGSDSEADNGHL